MKLVPNQNQRNNFTLKYALISFFNYTGALISSFDDTVGVFPLIHLHSGHHTCHLMYTNCPASVPHLLAQWAHTSSFYDTVGLYPLIYLHSGHHPCHLLHTNCPASVPPLLARWAHISSFLRFTKKFKMTSKKWRENDIWAKISNSLCKYP